MLISVAIWHYRFTEDDSLHVQGSPRSDKKFLGPQPCKSMNVTNFRRISAIRSHDGTKKRLTVKNVQNFKWFGGNKYTSSSALPYIHTYIFQKYSTCIVLQLFSCNTPVCGNSMFSKQDHKVCHDILLHRFYTPIIFRRSRQQIHWHNPVIICLAAVRPSDNKCQRLKASR
jgi:hypothetical protein